MPDDRPSLTQELSSDARLEIEAKTEEYQRKLQRSKQKLSTAQLSERQRRFREKLIEKEMDDERRDIDDIRKEEKFNISLNLVLSLLFLALFVGWAVLMSSGLEAVATKISAFFTKYFNWFYILCSSFFLIFLVYLGLSRFGNVVLGDPGEKPEFGLVSWCAMLFSAGMGSGLLFWGGAEPLSHYLHPPTGTPESMEAARNAMTYVSFHWGLHAWAIYTVCSVGVAYYGFRKRKQYLISSSVMDIFDSPKINRVLKISCDLTATLAIVFGVAASLGMAITQISAGLVHVFHMDFFGSNAGKIAIMVLMTICFIASATTGLKKGIQLLSNLNMLVAVALMLFMFLVGPKLFILKVFVDTLGVYLSKAFALGFQIAPFTPGYEKWMGQWTLTYFTWWIAWSPFVGIFIARISRGRTIRELIFGSLIIPTVFTIFWFSTFGGTSLYLEIFKHSTFGPEHLSLGHFVLKDVTLGLYALLGAFPFAKITSAISIVLMFTFLVTSADSATFVISMMTTEGDLDPKLGMKVLWGTILAVVTLLLVLGGGLTALQAASLSFAFPFSIVLLLILWSLFIRLSIQVEKKRI